MPTVAPINPNFIAALGQYFGAMQNRGIRTPPTFPTTQRREADAQGRIPPQRPMVIPTGSAAPTAPGTTPSPSSLGGALSNIPATAPATVAGQDDFGQPAQAPAQPVTKLGTVPEDAQEIYAPQLAPPGGKVFNKDGTTYIKDKEGRLIRTMEAQAHDPNAPAGGGQTPASMPQKKGGIWSRLTDPSLAGIALAAGQQLTRPRYPGETATGNAVNAVTAGYNTLAQQRQMQVARELAEREWKAKQDKAAIDKLKSEQEIAESKSRQQKIKDEAEDAKGKRNQARQDAAVREMEAIDKGNTARRTAETAQQNADSLKAQRENQSKVADQNVAIAESNLIIARDRVKALEKQNAAANVLAEARLGVSQGMLGVAQANSQRAAAKETNEKFLPFLKEAGDDIAARERNAMQAAYNAGTPYQPPSQTDHDKAINELAMKRYREAQRMQGKKGFEEPPNPLGPDIIPPPPGPAVRGPAAQPWQGVGPPAPAAAPRILGPVSDPRQEVEGRTGSYNGVPGIVRNGQWVAR